VRTVNRASTAHDSFLPRLFAVIPARGGLTAASESRSTDSRIFCSCVRYYLGWVTIITTNYYHYYYCHHHHHHHLHHVKIDSNYFFVIPKANYKISPNKETKKTNKET
jgi:hypothetical protein